MNQCFKILLQLNTFEKHFKENIAQYLKSNFPETATILDVGAGAGTYYNYLKDYFVNIEAVEIFEPNIKKYNL